METTAINSIYVVYVTSDYNDITVHTLQKAFFTETQAKQYVESMQKESDRLTEHGFDYVIESWYYKELQIY